MQNLISHAEILLSKHHDFAKTIQTPSESMPNNKFSVPVVLNESDILIDYFKSNNVSTSI